MRKWCVSTTCAPPSRLQLRDVDSFIHQDFRQRDDIRYIKKTIDTRLQPEDYATMVQAIREASCIPMATPFDESSVDFCCELGIPILKIASSDCNDWILIEKIAKTKKPVIVSTGGSSLKDIDDLVTFFDNRHIPLADQSLRFALSLGGLRYRTESDRLSPKSLSQSHHRVFHARVPRLDFVDADGLCQGRADFRAPR